MNRLKCLVAAVTAGAMMAAPAVADTINLRVASFVTPLHGMSQWIDRWAADLTERSGGRLQFEILHGAQMGPPPRYYDIARNGQADITWVLHGSTPGRFELTEVSNMPFRCCAAEQATRVVNHPRLRAITDEEHRGVEVLKMFAHPPGQIHMAEGAVTRLSDIQGKAMRPASAAVGQLVAELGGRPVGLPPTEIAEGLQRRTIDGVLIDFGGSGIAFQLGPHLSSATKVDAYISTFALVANPRSLANLPDDLREMIVSTMQDREEEVGRIWDEIAVAGRGILEGAGVEMLEAPADQLELMREAGARVTDRYVAELEGKGRPGAEVLGLLQELIAEVGPVGEGC
ncbi:MAG: TRAP transporter substrate-binding protein [Rhodobacteraceae bacterium]|nr:TRAP transporter substrate-binding protein [Paracoccaceae bacterium]